MDENLPKTWDDIAQHWDDWGPPLRPSPEDGRIVLRAVSRWHAQNPTPTAQVFLNGVTPEIATLDWPMPINMIAMDRSEGMVRLVWPGDVAGVRRAVVGDWLRSGLPPRSQDIVVGDGGFAFFDYPDGQRALTKVLHGLLKPTGLFVYRLFANAPQREPVSAVADELHAGRIGSVHAFRWRLAMALQPDSRTGVTQDQIWRGCIDAGIDPDRPTPPAWSRRSIETIRFSRGKHNRYYFPTVEEFRAVLAESFDGIEVTYPAYELGDRCPIITARPR